MKLLIDLDSAIYACCFKGQEERWRAQKGGLDFTTKKVAPKRYDAFYGSKFSELGESFRSADTKTGLLESISIDYDDELEPYKACEDFYITCDSLQQMVQGLIRDAGCTPEQTTLVVSGSSDYRKGIATLKEYKGNRKPEDKPIMHQELVEYACEVMGAVTSPDEADDWLCEEATKDPDNVLVATIDKDMMTFPGHKFYWDKRKFLEGGKKVITDECFLYVDKPTALRNFFYQMVTGDRCDNIPGLSGTKGNPGPGIRGAKKAFAECVTAKGYWNACLAMYEDRFGESAGVKYIDKEGCEVYSTALTIMKEQGALLWMVRSRNDPLWCLEILGKYFD